MPAQTHVAMAHAVEICGAKPVFVDAEPRTGAVDLDLMENLQTDRTRAISVVHYLAARWTWPGVWSWPARATCSWSRTAPSRWGPRSTAPTWGCTVTSAASPSIPSSTSRRVGGHGHHNPRGRGGPGVQAARVRHRQVRAGRPPPHRRLRDRVPRPQLPDGGSAPRSACIRWSGCPVSSRRASATTTRWPPASPEIQAYRCWRRATKATAPPATVLSAVLERAAGQPARGGHSHAQGARGARAPTIPRRCRTRSTTARRRVPKGFLSRSHARSAPARSRFLWVRTWGRTKYTRWSTPSAPSPRRCPFMPEDTIFKSLAGRRVALVEGAGFIGHHLALTPHRAGCRGPRDRRARGEQSLDLHGPATPVREPRAVPQDHQPAI